MKKKLIKIKVEGTPGKTPKRGIDYFTAEDQSLMIKDIMSQIVIPNPIPGEPGKNAIVDYAKIEAFVTKQVAKIKVPKAEVIDINKIIKDVLAKIPKQKEIVIDYPGIKAFCLEEIEKIENSRDTRYRKLNSGGPTTRLGELVDVNAEGATDGQALIKRGDRYVFETVDLSGYVPYTGATQNVDIGSYSYYGIGENLVMKNQPYLTVAGFGLTQINGDYLQLGSINGKAQYFKNLHWIYWDGDEWKIMQNGTGTAYVSSQDVATPDLITSWDVYVSVAPAGTIVPDIDPQTIDEAYVAKRTNLGSTERQALLIDGTNDPFLDIENYSTMQGIYMNRERLGYENVDTGSDTASFFNKGFYNKITQTGITSFAVKPPQFTLSSIGWENEIYSDLNPSGTTKFGSNEQLFGMTNIISKGGTFQPFDDGASPAIIGGNLNAYGLYNQIIMSPSIGTAKVTSILTGIDNSVTGTVSLGIGPNYTVTAIGSKNVVGVSLGSPSYPITRYGSYNETSQSGGTNYGSWNSARTQTATVNYGVWAKAELGNINWAFYNGGGNNYWGLDNAKSYFGTGIDASIYYDGTDLVFNPRDVGSGSVESLYAHRVMGMTQSATKLTNGTFTGNANGWTLGTGYRYNTNLVRKDLAGTGALEQPIASMGTPMYLGELCTITFVISNRTAGGVTVSCGGVSLGTYSANGTYTTAPFRVLDPTDTIKFTPSATTARYYIDTISLTSATDGTLKVDGATDIYGALYTYRSVHFKYLAISGTYTLTAYDYTVDCTANTFTVTLPTAVGIQGRIYNIKNSGTGVITVATTSSQTIDGDATQTVYQYENLQVQSNGANWIIL